MGQHKGSPRMEDVETDLFSTFNKHSLNFQHDGNICLNNKIKLDLVSHNLFRRETQLQFNVTNYIRVNIKYYRNTDASLTSSFIPRGKLQKKMTFRASSGTIEFTKKIEQNGQQQRGIKLHGEAENDEYKSSVMTESEGKKKLKRWTGVQQ